MTPNRIAAAAGAVAFGVVGVWGLAATATLGVVANEGALLGGLLGTNVLLSSIHLGCAIALGASAAHGEPAARRADIAVGTVTLLLGLFGLFAVGTPANLLALGGVGNVLHFVASSALLATGLGAASGSRAESETRRAASGG